MMTFSKFQLGGWFVGVLALSACATQYKVTTYPQGAKVRVENVVTKEVFEMGEGPVTFPFEERFGEGFVLSVEKDTFNPKKVFIARNSGAATNVAVTLEPRKVAVNPEAAPDNTKSDDEKKPNDPAKAGEDAEIGKRMAVLERTFEIYKDALFSQRYGSGPASYDRDRIDTQVALVTKAQQLIERKDFNGAEETVKKIIDRDEESGYKSDSRWCCKRTIAGRKSLYHLQSHRNSTYTRFHEQHSLPRRNRRGTVSYRSFAYAIAAGRNSG